MKIVRRKNMEQMSCMCWSNNLGRTWSCTDIPMSCNRNRKNNGCNMHSRMKLHQYKLRIHPNSWHKENMVSSFIDRMQGIQQHACRRAHTCNPTHSTHSPRRRQESSPTEAKHARRKVDAHDHQHTLEDHHGHYASMCFRFKRTQEDHAHVSIRVGWRGQTNALVATKARVRFSKMSPCGACTPSWTTKLGINSPPSPSQACQSVNLTTMDRVLVMSCKACSSHVVSHEYMCIVMLSHVKCKSSVNSWM